MYKLIKDVQEELPAEDTAKVLQQLNNNYHGKLAEALLMALAKAELLDGTPSPERISFECLPSVCRVLAKELTRIGWGQ